MGSRLRGFDLSNTDVFDRIYVSLDRSAIESILRTTFSADMYGSMFYTYYDWLLGFIRQVIDTAFVSSSNFCEKSDGTLRVRVDLLAREFMLEYRVFSEDACSSKRFVYTQVIRF